MRHGLEIFPKRLKALEAKEARGEIEMEHNYLFYLAGNGIEHTKTKARHPQTSGICERIHKTNLNEFYQSAFRRKVYNTIEELQTALDEWIYRYNYLRTQQRKSVANEFPCRLSLMGMRSGRNRD